MDKPQNLAQPLRIGNMKAKNRIWLAPLWTRLGTVNGEVTPEIVEHYRSRAKGGYGVICHESSSVDGRHPWIEPELRIDDDQYVPGLARLVDAVHVYNAPIIIQLHHAGMFGRDPVSPSGIPATGIGGSAYTEPKILTTSDIEDIRDLFIDAGVRARAADYDGVEYHFATAYLLEQFISPYNNKRTDRYGGSFERRIQFSLEIIAGARKKLGNDYVIGATIVDNDLHEHGICREDMIKFAKALENAGLSYLDLQNTGTYETFHMPDAPGSPRGKEDGQFETAAAYKKVLSIPVTTRTCGANDPKLWDKCVEDGMLDAIRVGRAQLPDTELPNKALAGQYEDIRDCIRCTACHLYSIIGHKAIHCAINAGAGNREPQIKPANVKKNVLVIGGGPGGIEAARVSAERGHKVTLVEKNDKLGGNLYLSMLPIAKYRMGRFITWGDHELKKLGVDVLLNTEADAAYVKNMKPDVVFIATGSSPAMPPIPGIDGANCVTAESVLLKPEKLGKHVVMLGGGEVGLETADFILEKGLAEKVTLVETMDEVGLDMNPMQLGALYEAALFGYMDAGTMSINTDTTVISVSDNGVQVFHQKTRKPEFYECDKAVIALGYKSNEELVKPLEDYDGETYVIGDAARPQKVLHAVHQAFFLASEV